MSLELTLLLTIFGVIFVSFATGEDGIGSQFDKGAPFLAGRMERDMTTGRCFHIPTGGGSACASNGSVGLLFESAGIIK